MGTSLSTIANHQISFEGKSLAEIVDIIQPKLNALELDNWDYLLEFASKWYGHERIYTFNQWFPVKEEPQYYDYDTASYKQIDFDGPFKLSISFSEAYIQFWNPPYRYRQWFGLQNADGTDAAKARNEWRKYMKAVVQSFGGNRAIYLADNSHPLAKYVYSDEPFTVIEEAIRREFGDPAKSFRDVSESDQIMYFIDCFDDL
jgi:hypothetical protein